MADLIAVHAGAGGRRDALERELAAKAAVEATQPATNALEAVCLAVESLEDDPSTNAALGSYSQMDGEIRCDAALMDHSRRVGSVIGVPGLRYPIRFCRLLLESDYHVAMAGEAALRLARELGLEERNLQTARTAETHAKHLAELGSTWTYQAMKQAKIGMQLPEAVVGNTVGAVAVIEGMPAAATSTGGLDGAYPGRVGDTPFIGAGTYAGPAAAVSCTGVGETIIRELLAFQVYQLIEKGATPQRACDEAVKVLSSHGGQGGVIAVSQEGLFGSAYNTAAMPTAHSVHS